MYITLNMPKMPKVKLEQVDMYATTVPSCATTVSRLIWGPWYIKVFYLVTM